jgi:hypothetical protein
MAQEGKPPTALGQPITLGSEALAREGLEPRVGTPPVVLQTQPHSFIPLERPEQLRQWEDDLRTFYGVSVDAARLQGHACETCSCGCTDDCGLM